MTSLEIAELTGKQHNYLMKAIRKMEPAWEKVSQGKFAQSSRMVVQPNGGVREFPCYVLTKTECLYIATKFNDAARAKLVLRWQELELQEQQRQQQLCLPEPKKILALADEIIGDGLRLLNAPAEDTLTATQVAKTFNMLTATQVAKTFNMTVWDFNCVLRDMGIQYRRYGRWNICDDLADRNLVRQRTHVSYSLKGEKKVKVYMTWTLDGLRFLNSKLGYPNF